MEVAPPFSMRQSQFPRKQNSSESCWYVTRWDLFGKIPVPLFDFFLLQVKKSLSRYIFETFFSLCTKTNMVKSYSSSLSVSETTPLDDIFDLFSFSSLPFPFAFTISFLTARSSASTELSLLRSKQNLIKPEPTWECVVKKQGISHFQGSTWREEGNLFLPSRSRLRIVTVPSRIFPSGGPCKNPGITHYIPNRRSGSLFSAAWACTSKGRV